MSTSVCSFCNSHAFGKGCPFSDHKTHCHINNGNRCIWCNSIALGPSCPFNPLGRNHIRGIEFNQMIGDSVEKGIVMGYLMKNLSDPYTNTKAYTLHLIDENGNILKKPETDEEKAAFTLLDEYTLTIKKLLGNKIDMINSMTILKLQESMNMEQYEKINEEKIKYANEFKTLGESFKKLIQDAVVKGVSVAAIEKLIIESIFNKK